jgi:hypothetical protein
MKDIEITFNPPAYKGWNLSFCETSETPFHARKESDFVSASTLGELKGKIREADEKTRFFQPRIKAAWQQHSGQPWEDVEFYAIRGEKLFFETTDGQKRGDYINNFRGNGYSCAKFRLKTSGYDELKAKLDAAVKANQRAYQKAEKIKKGFVLLNDAVFESAPTMPE